MGKENLSLASDGGGSGEGKKVGKVGGENRTEKEMDWVPGFLIGIVGGVTFWVAILKTLFFISNYFYFPHSLQEPTFFLSFPVASVIAGLISYRIGKNSDMSIVAAIVTLPAIFITMIFWYALVGGPFA